MEKRSILSVILLFLGGIVFTLPLFFTPYNKVLSISYGKSDTYEKLWKRVDSCEAKGLSESALKVVEVIYQKAKADNNAPQLVKSVIIRMKFKQYKEEFSLEKNINELSLDIKDVKFPAKAVLQNLLADAYWQYFNNNRWKFYNRSQTVNFKNDDLSTWDLKTITYAVIKNYKESLSNVDSLKATKIDLFDEVLSKGTTDCRQWRPTLYDFLAHRALAFLANTEPDVQRPANRFTINDASYLSSASDFAKLKLVNPSDSLETKYYALQLIQDLINFHSTDKNPDALIDVDLYRLDYIHQHSQNPKKDTLYFSSLNALQQMYASNERVTEIDHRIAAWYVAKGDEYKPLVGDQYKWYKKQGKEICEAAIKKMPNSYGAKECQNLIYQIQSKNLNLSIEEVNEPAKPFHALVNSTNINKLYFKVVKATHQELRKIYAKEWGEKLYNALNSLPTIKTFEQAIIDDGDFQKHNMEIKMPELPFGQYVIITSLNPNFQYSNNLVSYAQSFVSNIATMERRREDNGAYDVFAMHRQTGDPLKNISVQMWTETYDYSSRDYKFTKGDLLKTDDKGFLSIKPKAKYNENNFFLELINGDDHYFNNNSYYTYNPGNSDYTQTITHFFTDRAIYRPGQTVFFKGIVLESQNQKNPVIKANYPVTVTFYDVNYQKISSLDLTTNEYGSVNGSFIAPLGVLTGQMHITDGHGTAYFSVEEYKRPKFEANFNPVKGSYKINDEIEVGGVAKAYAGNVIDGAKVSYRVVRNVNYPYWFWWYRPYYSAGGDVEILNGETITNDTGGYIIKFKALPDESVNKASQATYQYQILADVIDINGETHSTSTYVTVGYQALQLNISSDAIINQKEIKPISFRTTNLNLVAEPAKGNFTLYKLKQPERVFRSRLWVQPDRNSLTKEEYYKTFPNDLFADELNKFKWEKEKQFDKTFDTGIKTEYDLSADLKNLKPGIYLIEANCKDKFGEDVKAFQYFTLYNESSSTIPEVVPAWFYAPKLNAEPGDKISFVVASSYEKVNYIYEVEQQNKVVLSQSQAASLNPVVIDIKEEHRGNVSFHASFIKNNRFYNFSNVITVPFTNKELDIQFESFRNKLLPGQQEEWKIVIKDKKGDKQAAELLTSMYDASLDAFAPSYWSFYIYNSFYTRYNWTSRVEQQNNSTELNNISSSYVSIPSRYYDYLNYFGLNFYGYNYHSYRSKSRDGGGDDNKTAMAEESAQAAPATTVDGITTADKSVAFAKNATGSKKKDSPGEKESKPDADLNNANGPVGGGKAGGEGKDLSQVKARSNFNETAFFFPNLTTNENGETVIKFTIPESLTKWKLQGLAHTKDLKVGQFTKEVVTQKDLMVQPNQPRFFRENDQIIFISKVANLSDKELSGNAELKLYDALTDVEISSKIIEAGATKSLSVGARDFTVKKGQSTSIEWTLNIPEGYGAIKYKIVAKAGNFSDGEEMVIPVLTNRMLVTESMPLPIRSNQTKEFNFTKFTNQNNNSTTLKNHAYTLEFTANPAWYAVQALPYIMEYPYECAEQTFARYYANSLASYVVNSKPKIKAIFDSWKMSSPDAFLSNLQKNQELKSLILEETPWVLQAKSESENKKRVGLLFDLNTMSNEMARAFRKLQKSQTSNGGFWWFEGGPDDWYITQHIACGFGHLDKLGVIKTREKSEVWDMLYKAVKYCDNRMREEYDWMKKHNKDYLKENHLSYMAIQYLYMRSFFKDIEPDNANKEHIAYYKKQEQMYWLDNSRYMQGMIALSLHRDKDLKTPKDILKSLKENSINSEEMGMYWKENYGYYWYEAPIEMQALMIEAFDEINNDTKAVDDLKTWLIKSKQTQHWGTTRSTTEAVYALLLKGTDWLSTEPNVEIQVGDIKLDPKNDPSIKVEQGTGYFKKAWTGSDIKPESMGKIKVIKKDAGVSYGAIYWQYFEQLDKITPHETPLKLKKQLFVQRNTASGPVIEPITATTKLKLGDKIKVRIELRVDRDMDYVHMKDMRASGFEPVNVFSEYKWQDGLGYYENTKDAATNFFFPHLFKGTFVFEYLLFVNHYGDFSNGVTTIQCMYAPEFTSHSEGVRVKVSK